MKCYLLILVLFPIVSKAQQATDFIRQAMTSNGQWEGVKAFKYATNRDVYNPFQSYDYHHPKEEKDVYDISVDLVNNRYMHHSISHYPGGYTFNTIRIGRDSIFYVYDAVGSRTGKSLFKLNGSFYSSNYRNALANIPYYILEETLNSHDSLQLERVGQEVVIRRTLKSGSQELWLDAQTGRLHKNSNIAGNNVSTQYFEEYTRINGYWVAQKIRQLLNDKLVFTDHLTTFNINDAVSPEVFNLPVGYHVEEEMNKPLIAKEIAQDIFLVEKVDDDRNVIFINMEDYVVVTEAPVSAEVTGSVIALIHQTLPGKPIKYVHLSHFHKDHIAGIRKFIAEGAAIVCTPSMEKPVRDLLAGITPTFVFFKDHKIISDSKHRIDLFEVPNSHAQGLSFMYLPKESIIFEGDLLALPEDATLTPAIPVSREFYQYLKRNKLPYKRIIGHHGLSDITSRMFDGIIAK
ncbi:MBL fold metallo-hydrolase [Chitinophaga sp. RAB17]|uniref:MBL fold metallo-hydrolase n=1 Tax=Chitinophaga sp. RAB17 TaxID=3233049 RepID=UPI003F8DFEF2